MLLGLVYGFVVVQMTPLIESSVESLMDILQQHADSNKSVEVFKYIATHTLITRSPK